MRMVVFLGVVNIGWEVFFYHVLYMVVFSWSRECSVGREVCLSVLTSMSVSLSVLTSMFDIRCEKQLGIIGNKAVRDTLDCYHSGYHH